VCGTKVWTLQPKDLNSGEPNQKVPGIGLPFYPTQVKQILQFGFLQKKNLALLLKVKSFGSWNLLRDLYQPPLKCLGSGKTNPIPPQIPNLDPSNSLKVEPV